MVAASWRPVRITNGKYAGHLGTIEANVYQKTVDYPDEWANGVHVMLDTDLSRQTNQHLPKD